MNLHIMKRSAIAVLTLVALTRPVQSGTLDDYYLQQFGEAKGAETTAQKILSVSADSLEIHCGMPLKHDLRRDWDKLEPYTQTVLAKQLAEPVLENEATLPSAHFIIHYATTGTDAPKPTSPYTMETWVKEVADNFEFAYTTYQSTYGYRPPPVLPYHVYLRSLAALRIYGQTTTTTPAPSAGFPYAYSSYIEIDKDFTNDIYTKASRNNAVPVYTPLDSLNITSAHEFHHAIQFGYNFFFDVWYGESTSTWYEGELHPAVRQNYVYVHPWFANSTRRLDLAVDADSVSTGAGYGRWIFNRYLAELHTSSIVRIFWENLASIPSPNGFSDIPMLPVINSALSGALPADFLGFSRRVYRQRDWPLAYDQTSAHLLYIPVSTYISYPVNSSSIPKPEVFLEQYSFAYYKFPIPTTTDVTIFVNGTPAIAARAFSKDFLGNITEYNFPNAYPSSVTIPNANGAAEIVLLLVNTSGDTTQNANFSTDGTLQNPAPVIPTVTTTPATTPVTYVGGGGGGGCFIATAAYGSYLHPRVQTLRDFRDTRLLTNAPGRAFVALYYRLSPPVAAVIAQHTSLRLLVRILLTPVVLAVAHPAAAVSLLLAALCGLAGCKRWNRTTHHAHHNHAV